MVPFVLNTQSLKSAAKSGVIVAFFWLPDESRDVLSGSRSMIINKQTD